MKTVFKVYSGKIGCMCGCLGKYSYTTTDREYGSADRGSKVHDHEVSDRSVKIMTKKVLNDPDVVMLEDMAYVEDRHTNRIRVVFFKKEAQCIS